MGRLRLFFFLAFAAVFACQPLPSAALGKPDWARPYLSLPTPSGAYIAKSDHWAIVYGEVEFAHGAGRGLEERCRFIIENLTDAPLNYTGRVEYDQGVYELHDLALNIQKILWHEINLEMRAGKVSVENGTCVVLVGNEPIEPHKRVVLEYTLSDKLGFLPWTYEHVAQNYPAARLRFKSADPAIKVALRSPGGAVLQGFSQEASGDWVVEGVPAVGRLPEDRLFEPDHQERFPMLIASLPKEGAGSFSDFIGIYRKAWEERIQGTDMVPISQRAAALCEGVRSPTEKACRLAAFVQHEIRYDDSNEKSLEGWVPLGAQEALRGMKADCKGKVMLLQLLLKVVGIESAPLLLRAPEAWFEWGDAPPTAFLNHVILAADLRSEPASPAVLTEGPLKGWVLFDPVVETASFGQPMPGHEGLPALVGAGPRSQAPLFVIHTAMPSVETSHVEMEAFVDSFGAALYKVRLDDNGQSSLIRRLTASFSEADQEAAVRAKLASLFPVASLRTSRFTRASVVELSSRLSLEVVSPRALQNLSSSSLLENPLGLAALFVDIPNGLPPRIPVKPDDQVAAGPPWDVKLNALGTTSVLDAVVRLSLPPGFAWTPPSQSVQEKPFLRYSLAWDSDGERRWKGTLHLEMRRGSWLPAERKATLQCVDEVFASLYSPLVLTKTP